MKLQDMITNNGNVTTEILPHLDHYSQEKIGAFADTDVYIKHVDLKKDGASMMSLSQIEATRRDSPCSYYQFAKGMCDRLAFFPYFLTKKSYCVWLAFLVNFDRL